MYREQDITNYTLVSLQQAFFIFIGLILLHGVAIFTLKMNLSNHFKEADWLNKIGHVVESLNVPEVYKDFDVDLNPDWERTPYDYKLSYDSVQKETFWMTFLQMVFNFLLLVPLLVTGEKKTMTEKIEQNKKYLLQFPPSFQSHGEALSPCRQHWDVR